MSKNRLRSTSVAVATCVVMLFGSIAGAAAAPTAPEKCDATKKTETKKDDCPKEITKPKKPADSQDKEPAENADAATEEDGQKPATNDEESSQQEQDEAGDDKGKKDNDKGKKKTKEEKEAEKKEAAEKAAALAAAQEALRMAEEGLPAVEKRYKAATKRKKAADNQLNGLNEQIQAARLTVSRVARQAYITGVDPAALAQVVTLESTDVTSWSNAQRMLKAVGDAESVRMAQAIATIEAAEAEKVAADEEFNAAKAEYDLVTLNIRAARFTLGLSSEGPVQAEVTEFFKSYPVPKCEFKPEDMNQTTRSCEDAIRYALSQVTAPEKSWFYLCLNLVTIAYGAPQTIPRAIDHWNGMPEELRHSPNTVAPPGALMFWAPNHVAISLGNNMLVSNDVLGNGRVWIVSFETIQARWGFTYLGWTAPDFRNA